MTAPALPDVLILAAGRGRRLRPLTDTTPKPLLPVGDKPLLDYHLARLAASGFTRAVINLDWLGDKIRAHVEARDGFGLEVQYSPEPQGALDTGGGIVNALPLLQSDPFIVINADVFCDVNFDELAIADGCDLHLILAPNPPHNPHGDFALRGGRLHRADTDSPAWTYAGIGCFRRRVFESLKHGQFPLLPVVKKIVDKGRAGGAVHRGRWVDVGSAERLAHAEELAREMKK